jgi:hypothetical protein
MIRKVFFNLLIIFMSVLSFANAQTTRTLSDQAQISVITCGAGEALYSAFGHTALRVKDPVNRIDQIYNYGTFDFRTENFYLKFVKGDLQYFLSDVSFNRFFAAYKRWNRSMYEQVLNLSQQEKQQIYELVLHDLKPENKYYRYQFFADNCSTRIYELILKALQDADIETDISYIKEEKTFRILFSEYVEKNLWLKFVMNLALGLEADEVASLEGRMFLPFELETALDHSFRNDQPIVVSKSALFTASPVVSVRGSDLFTPVNVLSLLALVIIILSFRFNNPKGLRYFDYFFFSLTSLVGILLTAFMLFSLHTPMHNNLYVLWLSPLNFLLLFNLKNAGKFRRLYIDFYLLTVSVLFLINLVFDLYVIEFLPLAVIIISRLWMIRRQVGSSAKGFIFKKQAKREGAVVV